jgi:hypothetical protein
MSSPVPSVRAKRPLSTIDEEPSKRSKAEPLPGLVALAEAVKKHIVPRRCDIEGYAHFLAHTAHVVGKHYKVSADVVRNEFERMVTIKLFMFDEKGILPVSALMSQMWMRCINETDYYAALQKKIGMQMKRSEKYPLARASQKDSFHLREMYELLFCEDYVRVASEPALVIPRRPLSPDSRMLVLRFSSTKFLTWGQLRLDNKRSFLGLREYCRRQGVTQDAIDDQFPLQTRGEDTTVAMLFPNANRMHIVAL